MAKYFETQTFLRISLTYTEDIGSSISSVKIKYKAPDGTANEWVATHDLANKKVYYDLVAGSPLAQSGRWSFWIYAVMTDTRILIGEVASVYINAEGIDKQ